MVKHVRAFEEATDIMILTSVGRDQSPLLGVVLCCTSIPPEQRGNVAAMAQEMGATHKLDLTSDVTHLIVGHYDTPKYKYVAKDRQDIQVLDPEWIEAVRASWMEGGETDVKALEEQYKLPTFAGLQICVTGFDDLRQRSEISETVVANGARYHGDLTKAVTHLIAAGPRGKKYEYAAQWGIKIVALEWLKDSLERGMILDETLYHPMMPAEKRGKGAVNKRREASPSLAKRPREDDDSSEPVAPGRRKLRRTTSSKLESQNDDLWADIGSADAAPGGQTRPHEHEDEAPVEPRDGTSFARPYPTPKSDDIRPESRGQQADAGSRENGALPETTRGVFSRLNLYIHGFDTRKTEILHRFIESNGGQIRTFEEMHDQATSPSEDTTVSVSVIIPHDCDLDSSNIDSQCLVEGSEIVTDFWVEKCLHRKAIINRDTPLCRPFRPSSIPGFETLTICPTSFSGIDLLHLSKVVKLCGAKYDEFLRPETSVLVCNDGDPAPNLEKFKYAVEHGVPVVKAEWLWKCMAEHVSLPFDEFLLTNGQSKSNSSHGAESQQRGTSAYSGIPEDAHQHHDPSPGGRKSDHLNESEDKQSPPKSSPEEPSRPLQDLPPDMNSPPKKAPAEPPSTSPNQNPKSNPSTNLSAHAPSPPPRTPSNPSPKKAKTLTPQKHPSPRETVQSPEKNAKSKSPHTKLSPTSHPHSNPPTPTKKPATTSASLTETLQSLLLQRNRRRSSSGGGGGGGAEDRGTASRRGNRRHRPLGRAPSNASEMFAGGSRGTSVSASASETVEEEVGGGGGGKMAEGDMEERGLFRPSQALGWGPSAGVGVDGGVGGGGADAGGGGGVLGAGREGFRRVESIGTVRGVDGALGSGVGAGTVGRRKGARRRE